MPVYERRCRVPCTGWCVGGMVGGLLLTSCWSDTGTPRPQPESVRCNAALLDGRASPESQ